MDVAARIASCLVGHHLVAVERSEHDWLFRFAQNAQVRVACPWRILLEGRIAHGDSDHAQQFGLPEAVDGVARSEKLLLNKVIERVSVRNDTGDLKINFTGRAELEILNMSSGYEGWHFAGNGLLVVAAGGGELTFF